MRRCSTKEERYRSDAETRRRLVRMNNVAFVWWSCGGGVPSQYFYRPTYYILIYLLSSRVRSAPPRERSRGYHDTIIYLYNSNDLSYHVLLYCVSCGVSWKTCRSRSSRTDAPSNTFSSPSAVYSVRCGPMTYRNANTTRRPLCTGNYFYDTNWLSVTRNIYGYDYNIIAAVMSLI